MTTIAIITAGITATAAFLTITIGMITTIATTGVTVTGTKAIDLHSKRDTKTALSKENVMHAGIGAITVTAITDRAVGIIHRTETTTDTETATNINRHTVRVSIVDTAKA